MCWARWGGSLVQVAPFILAAWPQCVRGFTMTSRSPKNYVSHTKTCLFHRKGARLATRVEWEPRSAPDFYTFVEKITSSQWQGHAYIHENGVVRLLGDVSVKSDEVMRACGGAVAGFREIPGGAGGIEAYGENALCEHNRGDDGLVFFDDGSFTRGPEALPEAPSAVWWVIASLVSRDGAHRLRVRAEVKGLQVETVAWSREQVKQRSSAAPQRHEVDGVLVQGCTGTILRATRSGPQWLRSRVHWREASGAPATGLQETSSFTAGLYSGGVNVLLGRTEGGDLQLVMGGRVANDVRAIIRTYEASGARGLTEVEAFVGHLGQEMRRSPRLNELSTKAAVPERVNCMR